MGGSASRKAGTLLNLSRALIMAKWVSAHQSQTVVLCVLDSQPATVVSFTILAKATAAGALLGRFEQSGFLRAHRRLAGIGRKPHFLPFRLVSVFRCCLTLCTGIGLLLAYINKPTVSPRKEDAYGHGGARKDA